MPMSSEKVPISPHVLLEQLNGVAALLYKATSETEQGQKRLANITHDREAHEKEAESLLICARLQTSDRLVMRSSLIQEDVYELLYPTTV